MYPIFVFAKCCCWSIHSKVAKLSKNVHSKQRNAIPMQTLQFRQVYVHSLLVQHLYHVIFFNVWFGMVQHQKQLGCREGRKID